MLADTSTISVLSSVLPQIAIVAALSGLIGWSLRGKFTKQPAAKPAAAAPQGKDRAKNLEAALEKSKDTLKTLKSEHESLKATAVSSATLEKANAELETARKSLEGESKRTSTLEADLKKAQDTIKNLNGRANDGDKAQKDRSFALENELSKTRQQLTQLEARPDDTAVLHAEIERLRESVAVSTRFAGEMRKREASAVEALEKAQVQLADLSNSPRPATVVIKKVGPVGDSDRVAAAKAEVLRLLESNKQATAVVEPAVAVVEPAMVIAEPELAPAEPEPVAEQPPLTVAETDIEYSEPNSSDSETHIADVDADLSPAEPIISETEPELAATEPAEAPPAPKKAPVHAELFSLD